MPAPVASERDLRLDLFRGLALWLIFLDHIPSNVVSWVTIRNYGFSDATEIFVFISGYTAAFVYGRAMQDRGFLIAAIRILRRAWQVYVAHMFLFIIFMAEIAYVGATLRNPLYAEEMNILEFLQQPDVTLLQALLLKFKPVNMDVLPLYIILLIGFPPALWLVRRAPQLALAGSLTLYLLTWALNWNLPAYPTGHWYFNPFAWQLLFVFGAWCATGGAERLWPVMRSKWLLAVAAAYLLFAFLVSLTWYLPVFARFMPRWLSELIYPIDKTNLDVLRFMHFLALAFLVVRVLPRDWPGLNSPLLWPAIVCGQQSLAVFCLGVFLAFTSHFILVEVSDRIPMQILVSAAGIVIMVGVASVLQWYKVVDGRRAGPKPPKKPGAGLAGGEA
ncbi:MAG TPA: OpgC domain-containing protein [Xanthobacteraceae bacterium]|nr:OpgC domain-containing protein [Xanthobacteraceae bacterium]